ncbi:MAG: hypothetical protein EXQ93_00250 [Alphaproteobacteria bacterium]|nr:hypothetical protein [Alphaproteobacteria bacterium]
MLVVVLFETPHLYALLVLHLGGVFFTAMLCHGELARLRPTASRLTGCYLWMSLGGVLGGILAAIVAPLVFNSVYEYPLAMLAAVLLRPWPQRPSAAKRFSFYRWALDIALPIALFALLTEDHWQDWTAAAVYWLFDHNVLGIANRTVEALLPWDDVLASATFIVTTILFLLALSTRPLRLALGMVAVLAVESPDVLGTLRYSMTDGSIPLPKLSWSAPEYRLERVRSFFGIYSVNYA